MQKRLRCESKSEPLADNSVQKHDKNVQIPYFIRATQWVLSELFLYLQANSNQNNSYSNIN